MTYTTASCPDDGAKNNGAGAPAAGRNNKIADAAKRLLDEIVPLPLLEKIAKIREIGADTELVDLLLAKAKHPLSLEDIINQLGADDFRSLYLHLEPELQRQVEIVVTPPSLLATAGRKARKESEIACS